MNNLLWTAKQHCDALSAVCLPTEIATRRSWSQHGEDSLLYRLFSTQEKDKYYVDVGANHPVKLSNTYRLYRTGMTGITVDPNIDLMHLHRLYRARDTQVCAAVAHNNSVRRFLIADYHGLSKLKGVVGRSPQGGNTEASTAFSETAVPVVNLTDLLVTVGLPTEQFGLLSVDVEGGELEVLASLDFRKYRPDVIIIEIYGPSDPVRNILTELGYAVIDETNCNLIVADCACRGWWGGER